MSVIVARLSCCVLEIKPAVAVFASDVSFRCRPIGGTIGPSWWCRLRTGRCRKRGSTSCWRTRCAAGKIPPLMLATFVTYTCICECVGYLCYSRLDPLQDDGNVRRPGCFGRECPQVRLFARPSRDDGSSDGYSLLSHRFAGRVCSSSSCRLRRAACDSHFANSFFLCLVSIVFPLSFGVAVSRLLHCVPLLCHGHVFRRWACRSWWCSSTRWTFSTRGTRT